MDAKNDERWMDGYVFAKLDIYHNIGLMLSFISQML
jgi:hypothetical protein